MGRWVVKWIDACVGDGVSSEEIQMADASSIPWTGDKRGGCGRGGLRGSQKRIGEQARA